VKGLGIRASEMGACEGSAGIGRYGAWGSPWRCDTGCGDSAQAAQFTAGLPNSPGLMTPDMPGLIIILGLSRDGVVSRSQVRWDARTLDIVEMAPGGQAHPVFDQFGMTLWGSSWDASSQCWLSSMHGTHPRPGWIGAGRRLGRSDMGVEGARRDRSREAFQMTTRRGWVAVCQCRGRIL
jgi:hypothetical protein